MDLVILVAIVLAAVGGNPIEGIRAGQKPFVLGVTVGGSVSGRDTSTTGEEIVLQIGVFAEYPGEALVRIVVPPAIEVVRGDTLRRIRLGGLDRRWQLVVRGREAGRSDIRGSAVFTDSLTGSRDVAGFLVPIDVGATVTMSGPTKLMRSERQEGEKKYQYVRGWLIPVDESIEIFESADEAARGAAVVSRQPARCDGCVASEDTVQFVAVIDKNGSLLAARPVAPKGSRLLGNSAVAIARAALSEFRFRPGVSSDGRNITDWIYVRVPIVPH